jgi:hypothetical protein
MRVASATSWVVSPRNCGRPAARADIDALVHRRLTHRHEALFGLGVGNQMQVPNTARIQRHYGYITPKIA